MFGRAGDRELIWDFVIADDVELSQRWILSAMQRHGPELVTMLWRLLGNEQDVCDVYQSIFLKLAHYEGRQKPANVKGYLFRTANNTAISLLRRRMAERRSFSVVGRRDVSLPSTELDSGQLQEALRYYMAQLPENLRNVIALRDLAELSYTRIGKILRISAATARVYRCKGIRLLAAWMGRQKEAKQ